MPADTTQHKLLHRLSAAVQADKAQMNRRIYFVLWFFNRLLFRADNYKIPAQQQAVNVGRHFAETLQLQMEIYFLILLLVILLIAGLIFWLVKIFKFYRQKRTKIAVINSVIFGLLVLVVCWELRLIPLSADWDFRNKTKDLTGKQFWAWNDYRYDEIGIRGEGFTFEIYKLNDEIAEYFTRPNKDFFERFPLEQFETTKWRETPILDSGLVDFITPIYGNWSKSLQNEIKEKQIIVRQVAKEKGSYYAVRQSHGTDL